MKIRSSPTVNALSVSVYTIPTEEPESDGTLSWDATTLVLVEIEAGGEGGLGFSYASSAAGHVIETSLKPIVLDSDAFDVTGTWHRMRRQLRNIGRPGIGSMAIAAVDVALWDLKARLLNLPLVKLIGTARPAVDAYGSGAFTSYSLDRLKEQLSRWVDEGLRQVKMKVGRAPCDDIARVAGAREAIGPQTALFVDANGAYDRKQALSQAEAFAEFDVSWFEEPLSSDDLDGLRLLRDRLPPGMELAAGEYGYDEWYFERMIQYGAVDVLQPDATRCEGISGFLRAAALCEASHLPFSAHTAPSLHTHICCATIGARHVEYFYDHARIERLLFDGALRPVDGQLHPNLSRPGLGLQFKRSDAAPYAMN